jgi:hypothetical protein
MTPQEAGKLGGLATFRKHGKEHMARIGKLGFNAYVKKHCGNVRKAGAQWLSSQGKIRGERPGTAAELRALHAELFPDGVVEPPDF